MSFVCAPLSFAWPDAAVRLLDFGAIAIHLSLRITAEAARFPWASVWTITPEGKEIFLYFLTLFLLFRPGIRLRQRSIALLPAALLILSFTRTLWLPERDHGLHAHILDVGQGNAVVLQVPGGGTTLIDGGGRESPSFNPGRNIIAPFLWHLRRWRVDDIIITHPHQDHYNGLAFILEHFHPQRLIINNDPGEETAYQELLNQARRHGVTMQYARAGDRLFSGREFSLDCLGMPGLIPADEEKSWSVNDRSLVLRARYGGLSLLFPGDIGRRSEALLVSSGKATPCDLLLAPHHGSRASLSPAFLRALSPALMVVSSGKSSTGVLPAPEHLRHWRQQSIPFLLTTEEGAVTISMQDGGISVSTSARKKHPASGTGKPASPAWLARPGTGHDNAPFIREPGTTAR